MPNPSSRLPVLLCALLIASWPVASRAAITAATAHCLRGGPDAERQFADAATALGRLEAFPQDEQAAVLAAMETAVKNGCTHAAKGLAFSKAVILTGLPSTEHALIDRLEDEIHALMLQATEQDHEGWAGLGLFYLANDPKLPNKYYSPREGVRVLEVGASQGDRESAEYLVHVYERGDVAGFPADPVKAAHWKDVADRLLTHPGR